MNKSITIDPLADLIPEREHLRYEPGPDQKLPGRPFEPGAAPGNSSLIPEQDADQKAGSQPLEPSKSETLLIPEQSADQKPRGEYSEFAETPEQDAGQKPRSQLVAPGQSKTPLIPEQHADQKPCGRPFEPGKSGNPNGRPKGSRNKATLLMEALLEGEAENIIGKVIEKAKEGHFQAMRFCGDRLLAPRRSRTVRFELPPIEKPEDAQKASYAVLAACANGDMAPSQANEVMSLIQAHTSFLPTEPSAADTTSGKKVLFRSTPADLLSALNKLKKE